MAIRVNANATMTRLQKWATLDTHELAQIAAVAMRGIRDLCEDARNGRIR